MRAPLRQERHDLSYVAISKIAALRELSVGEREVSIGACVTHAEIARELTSVPDCRALALAAGNAANPAIRQVATIGGNLCAANFAAADFVPALLCLDAEIELHGLGGSRANSAEPLSRNSGKPRAGPACAARHRSAHAAAFGACAAAVAESRRLSGCHFQPCRNASMQPASSRAPALPSDRSSGGTALARIGSRIDRPPARSGACGRKSGAPLRKFARSRRCRGAGMVSPESSSQSRAQSRKRYARTVVSDKFRTSMRCRCD